MKMSYTMEELASVQHDIWAHWMNYMFTQGTFNDDGWSMPKEKVERWQRQAATKYTDLTEKEKASDREQVGKIVECLQRNGYALD